MKRWFRRRRSPTASSHAPSNHPADRPPAPRPPCHTCRRPIARGEHHIRTVRTLSGERRYHRDCFLCRHCHGPIDLGQNFCYARLDREEAEAGNANGRTEGHNATNGTDGRGGERTAQRTEHPFHRECFARHFGWICAVCEHPLPMVLKARRSDDTHDRRTTRLEYYKHPFFDEKMCPHHVRASLENESNGGANVTEARNTSNNNSHNDDDEWENGGLVERSTEATVADRTEDALGEVRRCAGCHRFEPLALAKHFVDVGDGNTGRCVCLACCRTVVTSNEDAAPLWRRVVDFFEGPQLGLISGDSGGGDGHGFGGVTRRDMERIPILVVGAEALNDNMKRHAHTGHLKSAQIMTRGLCLSERTKGGRTGGVAHRGEEVGVTAILCLSGLPADLAASILAHEAMHAWIKLHPNFPCADPLPLRVEEGICQLVAFLFLNDGLDPPAKRTAEGEDDATTPSEERLRQYFRFCIETDEGAYGEGFRGAARAYAKMGMQELLYHVAVHRDFPPLPHAIEDHRASF